MNRDDFILSLDSPDNLLAIAVGGAAEEDPFTDTNRIFSTVFPSIHSPNQLFALISSKTENKKVIEFNDGHWELMEVKITSTDILYLLKNISFDLLILKQLKKQLSGLADSEKMYSDILDKEFPIGVLVVDNDYNTIYANYTLKRIFHIPSRVNLQKCYNYYKELKPCEDCIIRGIQSGAIKKKTFTTDDKRMITVEAHSLDEKFIITFRDTTKEIYLIKEIKMRQEELQNANRRIAEQNDILKRLSNINIRIAQMKNLDAILETMIDAIIETFSCKKGAILLFSETGKIENAYFSSDIPPDDCGAIIHSIDAEISQKNRGESYIELLDKLKYYTTQDLMNHDKLIGRIFLFLPEKTIDKSILELFLAQVIVFLENLELHRKLEETAQIDSLTGVFNRNYFNKQFNVEKELSMRFGQPLSLILLDLNGLKEINDRAGHEAGDHILAQTARLLSENTGAPDSIYRIGGDEFVILLSNCPESQLNSMTTKLKETQSAFSVEYDGNVFPICFCAGGACSTAVPHDRLKDEADKRMYAEKTDFYKTHQRYR